MRTFPERHQQRARIEIIPMIDVMMFLLVFFVLISLNVLPALGLKVALPQSAETEHLNEPKRVTLTIEKDGSTFLDGQPCDLSKLADQLAPMMNGDQKPAVIIAGDGASELQRLVDVLDALKAAGVPAASIVAKSK
jgi:biopolymer transport protein ExbD